MSSDNTVIRVAVAVIRDSKGRVLLAQRQKGQHLAGHWEFPGGKIETNEPVLAALARELDEELGIEMLAAQPLISISHSYPERRVELDTWEVTAYNHEAYGREGQAIEWVGVDHLGDYQLPAADVPIVNAIKLPERYFITPAPIAHEPWLEQLRAVLSSGVRLVQLRGLDFNTDETLARKAISACRESGARVLLNSDIGAVQRLGADGVHLKASQLAELVVELKERPLAAECWVAASCHSADELARAAEMGVDFAVLGPLQPTDSHPHAEPLGWAQTAKLMAGCNLPVYGLGGLSPAAVPQMRALGLRGVAGISGFIAPACQ